MARPERLGWSLGVGVRAVRLHRGAALEVLGGYALADSFFREDAMWYQNPIHWIILLIMVYLLVQCVIELRAKRWWSAIGSVLIIALMGWYWLPLFVAIFKWITGTP